MMNVNDCNEMIKNIEQKLLDSAKMLDEYGKAGEYDELIRKAEENVRITSGLYDMYRELVLSLYSFVPSLGEKVDIVKSEMEMMGISVEKLDRFSFPVYRISLPMLLPNRRRRKDDFNNAVTNTVNLAVRRFCEENHIRPFNRAAVCFLSYCASPLTMVDNDNKESSVVINGFIGCFIRDDSPESCDTFYYYRHVEKGPKTEVYIVDSDHDIEVLSMIKSL